jgi:HD superfamily phosphohydrolase
MPVQQIRERLNAAQGFWGTLHQSLDGIGFTDGHVERMRPVSPTGRTKYIKDSVWGMMPFAPDELAVIDSPLLQRLRRVRQLGLSYLTYPSAEHTRFVHTLGVTHVVKRLLASISEVARRSTALRAGGQSYSYYDPSKPDEHNIITSLIHAALLHDCGHLAFSHAGESAFTASPGVALVGGIEIEDFIQIFREASFNSSLSECLSIAICLSPRFRAFYSKVIRDVELEKRINEVCSLIGGVPHDPTYPGLANIISGDAVDADKIDYLNRDARECGIPVGVDVSRVFLNSAIVQISESQAITLSRSKETQSGRTRFVEGWHFIVNSTGMDTYDELANAKSALFHRVYLHQMTRNAEQVLAAVIRQALKVPTSGEGLVSRDIFSWFHFGDDELLAILARKEPTQALARRLLTRDMPRRAFALFREVCEPFVTLRDIFDAKEWPGGSSDNRLGDMELSLYRQTSWKLFAEVVPIDPSEGPRRAEELRTNIRVEAIAARRILDSQFDPATLRADEPFIGFASRVTLRPISEVLVREKNSIGTSSHWSKSEELMAAEGLGRSIDYFYSDEDWCISVAIACVKILYDFHAGSLESSLEDRGEVDGGYDGASYTLLPRLNLRIDDICSRIGVDHTDLLQSMTKVAVAGFFGGAERAVPLEPQLARRCVSIADRYSQFLGERGWRVTDRSLQAFARQYPVQLRKEILDIVEQGEVLGRGRTREALDHIVRQLSPDNKTPLIICPGLFNALYH